MRPTSPPVAANPPPPPPPMPAHASGPVTLLPIDDNWRLCPYRIASLVVVFVLGLTMGNSSAHHARDKLERPTVAAPQRCAPIIETIPYCPPRHVPETSPHAESILRGPSGGHPGRPERPVFRNK